MLMNRQNTKKNMIQKINGKESHFTSVGGWCSGVGAAISSVYTYDMMNRLGRYEPVTSFGRLQCDCDVLVQNVLMPCHISHVPSPPYIWLWYAANICASIVRWCLRQFMDRHQHPTWELAIFCLSRAATLPPVWKNIPRYQCSDASMTGPNNKDKL